MSLRLSHTPHAGLALAVLVVALAGASGCDESQPRSVTEKGVRELLHSVDQAVQRQNATELGVYVADGAPVRLRVGDGLGGGMDGDKAQYIQALQKGFRRVREYRYERSDTAIAIDEDSSTARAMYAVREALRYDESTVRAVTRYTIAVAYRDGVLKITAIEGHMDAE